MEMQLQAAVASSEQRPTGNESYLSNEQVWATMETKISSITDGDHETRRRFGGKGAWREVADIGSLILVG